MGAALDGGDYKIVDGKIMTTHQSGRIYRAAKSFYDLAKPAFDDNSILESNVMAVVANLALAVELFLKAADAKVTVSPRGVDGPLGQAKIESNVWGHDLEQLFDRMDRTVSTRLQQLFEQETGKELKPLLVECKDYFAHARYFYEPKHQHGFTVSAVKILAEGLDAALMKGWGPQP
ncbi:hypothetical protein RugamoR64_39650 [Duganella rhizosphaerae]|uniref:hypothetical protein n=1 Tax=Duganella rhizosphaerae TaxID=2885763 RepID=UPI0030EABEB1